MIVRCKLEPDIDGNDGNTVTYRFIIAAEQIPHSRLTVTEIDDYKKSLRREHLIGGGRILR